MPFQAEFEHSGVAAWFKEKQTSYFSMDTQTPAVHLNNARHRFEMTTDGKLSFVEFQQADDETLALVHTEVHPDLEGQGVGSKLVKGVLDYIRRNNLHMMPYCPFVSVYVKRHPDYQDLVSPGFNLDQV